jgi:predicted ATPase
MKRIINHQVFLEETDPYIYDQQRRNQYAMDAAEEMLNRNGFNQYTTPLHEQLPPLEHTIQGDSKHFSMFKLP